MTMMKNKLRDLWKCQHRPNPKKHTPAKKAVQSLTYNNEIRVLKIECCTLKVELSNMSSKYKTSRRSNVAVKMADLIVKIETLEERINLLQN